MRADGLTLDDTGRTLHPTEKRRRLRVLCHWYGDERDGQVAAGLILATVDLEEKVKLGRWLRAHLGRYLRFSPSEVDRMGWREAWKYVKIASEILTKEAGKIPTGED